MTTETTAYHVLFLASWFPNKEFKTLGNFVKRHAKSVSSLHHVSVLYTYPSENASDYNWEVNHQDNYHEYILYYPKKRPNVFFSSRSFKVALAKFEAENELKVDLIHLNVLYPAARQALYLNRKWDIPFLVTEHWTGFHSDTHSTIKPWQKALMKTAVNKASFVCPVSEHLGVAMRKHGLEGAYKVVPNVVDTKLFKLPTEKEQKAYTFLHVSSLLDQHKNVSGLLRVFKKLTENHTDVFLQIVGDGDISPHVNYANELGIPPAQLSFEGEQPLDQIASYMRQADNFVLFNWFDVNKISPLSAIKCSQLINTGILDTKSLFILTSFFLKKVDKSLFRSVTSSQLFSCNMFLRFSETSDFCKQYKNFPPFSTKLWTNKSSKERSTSCFWISLSSFIGIFNSFLKKFIQRKIF